MTLSDLMGLNFQLVSAFILWAAFCIILFIVGTRAKIEEAFKAGHVAGLAYGCGVTYSGDADYSYDEWTKRAE